MGRDRAGEGTPPGDAPLRGQLEPGAVGLRAQTFWERMRYDRKTGELVEPEPLRERLPAYLKAFLIGLAAATLVGLAIGGLSSMPFRNAIGYAWIFSGTVLLLIGGARGGGYSNLSIGAVEALVGGRNRTGDDYAEDSDLRRGKAMQRRDPMTRLRKGLRPPPNPTAFWQAVAGFVLIALGLPLTF
jgi:hypothetical protein